MSDLGFIIIPGAPMWPVFDTQAEAEAKAEEWLLNGHERSVVVCEIKTRARDQGITWERAE